MSQSSEEKKHLAILLLNLKGKKNKRMNLIDIAQSCDYLTCLYGSVTKVAEKTGVHPEMIREFRSLLKLPERIKPLVQEIGVDAAYRISKLEEKDAIDIAELSVRAHLDSHAIREAARLKATNPRISAAECVDIVLRSKPKIRKRHLLLITLDEALIQPLKECSSKTGLSEKQLLANAITSASSISVSSIDIKDDDIILILEDSEFSKLKTVAQSHSVSLETLANRFIGSALRGGKD